jgi:protein-disulfide isomerase
MSKKQGEALSKRQSRKEEIRRKERQQRIITLGALGVAVIVILGLIIVPSIQSAMNPGGDFERITPGSYPTANRTALGDPNAKVKIDLFEDFQCHACKTYANEIEPDVISQIVDSGSVYYVFHQYPFLDDQSADKGSDRAALASECAADQNRFWDYKKILFSNQTGITGQFSEERLLAFAKSLGLDMATFEPCLKTAQHQDKVDAGIKLGDELGVKGTPSMFVNGIEVSPGQVPTLAQISLAVQQALQGN